MHLVDRLITAIKEQDVLYTIIWIQALEEVLGGDLGHKINKLHSTEDCTPFSAAVELPYSPLRTIILQILLLSGADFRGCRLRSKTQEMGKRLNKVRSDWASGQKDQAHDAKMLLNLPLEEVADWIDEHLPPPPNSDSLTGSDIPLPPSPRSTPTLATAPIYSPPRISIPLPEKMQHQAECSLPVKKSKRLEGTPKSPDQLAFVPSTSVKAEQSTATLPSPPLTAELAATSSFSSHLPSFTPPPESVEPPASQVHQHTISKPLSEGRSPKSPRQRLVSPGPRSPRILLPKTSEPSLNRSTARSRSPHLPSSPQSKRRTILRSRSPPIPPHPNDRSRRRFRSPSSHKSHPRVPSRSPSPRRIRGRSPSSYGPRHRLPSPRLSTQRSPPRFERERLPSPLYELGQPLRWDPTVGLVAVQRKGGNSRW